MYDYQDPGLFGRSVEAFISGCNKEAMYQRISSRSHAWFTFINMSIKVGFVWATVTNMAAKIATLMTQNNFVGGIMHASLSSVSTEAYMWHCVLCNVVLISMF